MLDLPNARGDLDGVALKFKLYLRTNGSSSSTIKNYLSDLRSFSSYIKKTRGVYSVSQIDCDILRSYLKYLQESLADKPQILNRKISALRKFLGWAAKENLIVDGLEKDLVTPTSRIIIEEKPIEISTLPLAQKVI